MKNRILLAIVLLGLSFCFVSNLGYGAISNDLLDDKFDAWIENKVSLLDNFLLQARVDYLMMNSSDNDYVWMRYDLFGSLKDSLELPKGVNTVEKIVVVIQDHRDILPQLLSLRKFSLSEVLEMKLTTVYGFIEAQFSLDMNEDIVAILMSKEGIKLAYFYQGEYHLWEE